MSVSTDTPVSLPDSVLLSIVSEGVEYAFTAGPALPRMTFPEMAAAAPATTTPSPEPVMVLPVTIAVSCPKSPAREEYGGR